MTYLEGYIPLIVFGGILFGLTGFMSYHTQNGGKRRTKYLK